jgi:hypothetical protein
MAVGASDDTINREGSGDQERQRQTKSNNSLNPTRRQQGCHHLTLGVAARGLIRALGA